MDLGSRPARGLLVLGAIALAACSGRGSTGSATPSATSSTARGTQVPPAVVSGNVRTGEARIEVSGAIERSLDLTEVVYPNVFSPPGGMAITWRDPRGDLFGIGGRTFTGERETTPSLILSLAVRVKAAFVDLSSTRGECAVTIDRADAVGLEGSFDCTNLGKGAQRINATGTFAASP